MPGHNYFASVCIYTLHSTYIAVVVHLQIFHLYSFILVSIMPWECCTVSLSRCWMYILLELCIELAAVYATMSVIVPCILSLHWPDRPSLVCVQWWATLPTSPSTSRTRRWAPSSPRWWPRWTAAGPSTEPLEQPTTLVWPAVEGEVNSGQVSLSFFCASWGRQGGVSLW